MAEDPTSFRLAPTTLDDRTLHSIGRLIRAAAELEDLVTLAVGEFAKLDEDATATLLGRSPVSARISILQTLVQKAKRADEPAFKWLFGPELSKVLGCRNAVAHGSLLGQDPNGCYAFQTSRTAEVKPHGPVRLIDTYSAATLAEIADKAESVVPMIERDLQLQALRQKRYERSLAVHRKGQSQRKRS